MSTIPSTNPITINNSNNHNHWNYNNHRIHNNPIQTHYKKDYKYSRTESSLHTSGRIHCSRNSSLWGNHNHNHSGQVRLENRNRNEVNWSELERAHAGQQRDRHNRGVHGRRLHLGPAAHAAPALLQAVPLRAGLRSRLAVEGERPSAARQRSEEQRAGHERLCARPWPHLLLRDRD